MSRISHLNNSKQHSQNVVVKEIINDFLKFNIKKYTEHRKNYIEVRRVNIVTRMVKYAVIMNIEDQNLWRKLISNINHLDF